MAAMAPAERVHKGYGNMVGAVFARYKVWQNTYNENVTTTYRPKMCTGNEKIGTAHFGNLSKMRTKCEALTFSANKMWGTYF